MPKVKEKQSLVKKAWYRAERVLHALRDPQVPRIEPSISGARLMNRVSVYALRQEILFHIQARSLMTGTATILMILQGPAETYRPEWLAVLVKPR